MTYQDGVVLSTHEISTESVVKDNVYALVASANANATDARKILNSTALEVFSRAMEKTISMFQNPGAREIVVMREVADFIKVATEGAEPKFCHDHFDLLPVGHPLSTASFSQERVEDAIEHRVQWLAHDPKIQEEYRPLVASAYRAEPGSVERKYLVEKIKGLPNQSVPRKTIVSLLEEQNNH